jgi:hypothetical protein
MNLEITGKLHSLLPRQTGEGKNGQWVKQEFILETTGEYPRKVCISAWGDKAKEVENLQPGDVLKIGINLESREYNSRWYTDVRAWRIDKVSEGGNSTSASSPSNVPPPSIEDIPGEDDNDLPF